MNITLRQIAYLVIDDLSGGDVSADSGLDPRNIMLKARGKLAYMAKLLKYERYAQGDRTSPSIFIYTYENQKVNKAQGSKYATATLPDNPIDLPYNKGIHEICPQTDIYEPYTRRLNQGVTRHTRAGDLEGEVGWWTQGREIILSPKDKVGKEIAIKLLLPAPDVIGEDVALPMTPELLSQLVEELKKESILPVKDTLNDNNKDLGVSQ